MEKRSSIILKPQNLARNLSLYMLTRSKAERGYYPMLTCARGSIKAATITSCTSRTFRSQISWKGRTSCPMALLSTWMHRLQMEMIAATIPLLRTHSSNKRSSEPHWKYKKCNRRLHQQEPRRNNCVFWQIKLRRMIRIFAQKNKHWQSKTQKKGSNLRTYWALPSKWRTSSW